MLRDDWVRYWILEALRAAKGGPADQADIEAHVAHQTDQWERHPDWREWIGEGLYELGARGVIEPVVGIHAGHRYDGYRLPLERPLAGRKAVRRG